MLQICLHYRYIFQQSAHNVKKKLQKSSIFMRYVEQNTESSTNVRLKESRIQLC